MLIGFARRGGNRTRGVRNHGSCLPYTGNGCAKIQVHVGTVSHRDHGQQISLIAEGLQEISRSEEAKRSISSLQKTLDIKGSWILFYRRWGVVSHLGKQEMKAKSDVAVCRLNHSRGD